MNIHIKELHKSFGRKKVLDDISFDVASGEIFALLGSNGSGKTTTIRCLLNIYQPDSGTVHIDGKPFDLETGANVGYLPEERGLYATSKVLETLTYFAELKGLSHADAVQTARKYLEEVGLGGHLHNEIKTLSSGQQQKIQLGIAIINKPSLLILDEPTKGLDPVNRDLLMKKLLELNKAGSTIIFITHQMEEVEKIANRLLMIKGGQSILYGSIHDVRNQFGSNTVHLRFEGALPKSDLYDAVTTTNTAELTLQPGVNTQDVLHELVKSDVTVKTFDVSAPSLHEIFVQVSQQHV